MLVLVVSFHTHNHGSLIEQGQIIDAPGDSSDFGTNLSYYFGNNCLEVLSVVYCASQDDLRDYWNLLEQESLQVRVQVRAVFATWEQQNDDLDI